MSRALLFDIGNVLVHFDFTPAIRSLALRSRLPADQIGAGLAPLKAAHEVGRLTDREFASQAAELIGFRGSAADFALAWSDIFTENPPMTAFVRRLAGRHRLLLLSNTSALHKDWLFREFAVFSLFEAGVYSYETGTLKPGAGIYETAIARFGLDSSRTLYIDDLEENISAGARLGFVTQRYSAAQHDAFLGRAERWLQEE